MTWGCRSAWQFPDAHAPHAPGPAPNADGPSAGQSGLFRPVHRADEALHAPVDAHDDAAPAVHADAHASLSSAGPPATFQPGSRRQSPPIPGPASSKCFIRFLWAYTEFRSHQHIMPCVTGNVTRTLQWLPCMAHITQGHEALRMVH